MRLIKRVLLSISQLDIVQLLFYDRLISGKVPTDLFVRAIPNLIKVVSASWSDGGKR